MHHRCDSATLRTAKTQPKFDKVHQVCRPPARPPAYLSIDFIACSTAQLLQWLYSLTKRKCYSSMVATKLRFDFS
jgi:hypothetical protein